MPNTAPDLILFDLGDVVCHFRPERRLAALSRASGMPTADLDDRLWNSGLARAFDQGDYTAAEMITAIKTAIGVDIPDDHLIDLWCLAFEIDAAVITRARHLAAAYRVGMLTNNPPLLYEALPSHFPDLIDTFEPILFSSAFGVRKPAPGIFRAVEEHVALAPEQLMLIDDAPANVDAARLRGWRGVVFAGLGSLRF